MKRDTCAERKQKPLTTKACKVGEGYMRRAHATTKSCKGSKLVYLGYLVLFD